MTLGPQPVQNMQRHRGLSLVLAPKLKPCLCTVIGCYGKAQNATISPNSPSLLREVVNLQPTGIEAATSILALPTALCPASASLLCESGLYCSRHIVHDLLTFTISTLDNLTPHQPF